MAASLLQIPSLIGREEENRTGAHRSHALIQALRSKSKAPPLKSAKYGAPKFNHKARATRPALDWSC
jgi:hypothetical protein